MAYLVKKYPFEDYCNEFTGLIYHQNLIGDINLYTDYSCEQFYQDICKIVGNDKYYVKKSYLKMVTFSYSCIIFVLEI